jgi:hypothetical protein
LPPAELNSTRRFTFDDRHWHVSGVHTQLSSQRLRVKLRVARRELVHVQCYLACVSRLLPQPLAVLIQSSSAAGKTSLLEATLRFMPGEQQLRTSSLTGQSLYYMGRQQLKHKILSIAEEQGVAQAAYALKLLQSEGSLSIACVGKDTGSGRPQTQHFEVEGPVAMLLTTTADQPDEELANRCLLLSVNEQPQQTAAIHCRQRAGYRPEYQGLDGRSVERRHQDAQRLLEPLRVVIPWADQLTFRTDQIRYRRDHAKYLALIAASTLLHQHQRQRIAGKDQPCVVATWDDVLLANRLANEALGPPPVDLLPRARQLLSQLVTYVRRRGQQQDIPPELVRFTQREIREALRWSDHALRRQLARLVQLEYVAAYRTRLGNQRTYQLLYQGQSGDGLGLLSARPAGEVTDGRASPQTFTREGDSAVSRPNRAPFAPHSPPIRAAGH